MASHEFAVMENIERKTGPIEEGRTLKIMNLNLDEIKILLESEKVTKNQKKRLLKRQKEISHFFIIQYFHVVIAAVPRDSIASIFIT